MIFISRHDTAELSLTTPPACCCNCGGPGPLDFIETPMKKVRYYFIFGTELTLTEYFPYCANCKNTAARIRQGWLGKTLLTCMVIAAMFLALVIGADALPKVMSGSLFYSAVAVGIVVSLAWFYALDWSRTGRTYYQPVSLADSGENRAYTLKFYNRRYAAAMIDANRDLIQFSFLRVETRT
jgi:hypothetical protein